MQETWVQSLGHEDLLEKEMATHSIFLSGKSHGWRSLVGYSPWGCKESDRTERLHFHFQRCTHSLTHCLALLCAFQITQEFSHKAYEVVTITMITLPMKKLVCEKVK